MKNSTKAIFFDRDGTLNVDVKYLHRVKDFIWIEGAREAVKFCNDSGRLAIIVTNQSGIARGYYDATAVFEIHSWMQKELGKIGAHLDDIFYCPHHVDGIVKEYARRCDCRKPAPGMLEAAIKKYGICRSESFFVGDAETDMECAKNAGVTGIRYTGGNLLELLKSAIEPWNFSRLRHG